jgi:hypothetical protein
LRKASVIAPELPHRLTRTCPPPILARTTPRRSSFTLTESSKAVFLSYASQDAPAALRMCETLRQAGVEVWLDQSVEFFEPIRGDPRFGRLLKRLKLDVYLPQGTAPARAN